jgi:arylsulfatase
MRFAVETMAGPATVTLGADGTELARVRLPTSMLLAAGNGETLDVGRDLGVPVTRYETPHGRFQGEIPRVTIDFD